MSANYENIKINHNSNNLLVAENNDCMLNFDLEDIRTGVEEGFNDFKNGKYIDYRIAFERLNKRLFNE